MLKTSIAALKFLLVGLAVGVLTAPRSGTESRQLITDRLSEVVHLRRSGS